MPGRNRFRHHHSFRGRFGPKRMHRRLRQQIRLAQTSEATEAIVYDYLSKLISDPQNKKVLQQIAQDEKRHAAFWQTYTQERHLPNRLKIFFYILTARLFGFTFAVKLMEQGETNAQINYGELAKDIQEAKKIQLEEETHEHKLINLLDEARLKYIGSMVLGVNDALVELTGAMAGLTLALQQSRLIGVIGLITGIAASFSMAASEYLSTKTEAQDKDPVKASIYTGLMYILTVFVLVTPFLLINNVFISLASSLTAAILIILIFTFYISVAQNLSFKHRFLEMAGISLSVSALTFGIGYVIRNIFGIDI